MNLFKRIAFIILIIAALGGATWAYFHLKKTKKPALKAISVLPDSAICVLSSHNFSELANKLGNQNLIWNDLINVEAIGKIHKNVQFFDSIIGENDVLRDFFRDETVFLSLYNSKDQARYLVAFNLKDMAQEQDFTEQLSRSIKGVVKSGEQFEFNVYDTKVFLRIQQGVVTLSDELVQIENAFNENAKKIISNRNFTELQKLNEEENLLNVYMDHELLASSKKITGIDPGKFVFRGHTVFNAEVSPDEISFNGFNAPDTSSILNIFEGQQAQECDFLNGLPFNTIGFIAYGFNDFNALRKKIQVLPEGNTKFWKGVNDSALFNAEQEFYNNIRSKFVEARIKHNNVSKILILEVKDTARSAELMKYMCDSLRITQNIRTGKLRNINGNLAESTFGKSITINPAHAFIHDKYFILCEDKDALEYCITSFANNSSLAQNEMFMKYAKENLELNYNYLFYSALNKNTPDILSTFPFLKEEDIKQFSKLSDLCLNISNYKSMLQFRLNVKYLQTGQGKETPGLWTFEADTVIRTKAYPFVNHKTGENELVIQDMKNNIYLVNATGNSLWKVELKEPVNSEIYRVDAFKNNKFQILFSTPGHLHLLDRNGKYVDGFPVKLPEITTNGLTLFDYDGKKDYRLFVACADNKIYNFEITGKRNEGFTPVKTQNEVRLPVKYIKVGASDYLITSDVEGKIYVFSRKGEGRIDLKNRFTTNCKEFYISASNNIQGTKLFYFDGGNSLVGSISLDDKKNAIKLGDEFENASVKFDLIDDDKKTDMIVLDKTRFKCYDLAGNIIFTGTESPVEYTGVNYYYDSEGSFFILNTVQNEVQLIQASGQLSLKKFSGSTEPLIYDLFKDGKKYFILGDGNTLKCILLR